MNLMLSQLDQLYQTISKVRNITRPKEGWIKTIRMAIGMSSVQLARRLDISRQSMAEIELREADGSITLNTLRNVANALDLELHYILIPRKGTLEKMINDRINELAKEIVHRTSQSMKLEDQENEIERINDAIKERAEQIKAESIKNIWN